ncbi:MAG: hypothetical protein U9P71_09700 [Campylobacterota bacterium]|nr:hypothetical protein [Campylobacterota bacterium]
MHSVVVVALSLPLKIGLYNKENRLVKSYELNEHTSESLPRFFSSLLDEFEVSRLIYAKGPGSFMAIKVSYLFLKTLSIVKGIELLATDAFYFNNNTPIKAVGKLFFVKMADKIETQVFEEVPNSRFELPQELILEDFSDDSLPYYGIAAVS